MTTQKQDNLIDPATDQIRIAIVGMGKMGQLHLKALQQLAQGQSEDYYKGPASIVLNKIQLVGICDRSNTQLQQYQDITNTYTNFADLLKNAKPNIAIIATPTTTHFEYTKLALEHNVHCLVEKPLVTQTTQLDQLKTIADQNGLRLLAGHIERYNPVAIKVKSVLQEQALRPNTFKFTRTQPHDPRIPDSIIVDKVIHDMDLAMFLFGPIQQVQLQDFKLVQHQAHQANLKLTHNNGITGSIFVSWLTDQKQRTIEIQTHQHQLLGDFVQKKLSLDQQQIECQVPKMVKPTNNQLKDQLLDFAVYCCKTPQNQKRIPPLLSLQEVTLSVKFIQEIINKIEQ